MITPSTPAPRTSNRPLPTRTMTADLDRARERIDTALREHDHCQACGQPMQIRARGGVLWLECATLGERDGLRFLLSAGLHDRYALDLSVDGRMAA